MGRGRRIAYAALVAAFVLFVAEIGARWFVPRAPRPDGLQLDPDPELLWTLADEQSRSGDFAPNELGFRGPHPGAKTVPRVLSLGDSSVYGDGVAHAEVFTSILESRLAERGVAIQGLDGGVPGYSSEQARVWYGRLSAVVAPDVVVIATLWSDARHAEETDRKRLERTWREVGFWSPVIRAARRLDGYSALTRGLRMALDGSWDDAVEAEKVEWDHLVGNPRPPAENQRVPLGRYRENLDAMIAAVRDDGAIPILLVLPHPLDESGTALPGLHSLYRDALRTAARENDAALVDAGEWFRAHPASSPRFVDDIHPSAAGHRDIAVALLTLIEANPVLAARIGLRPQ